MDSAVMPPDDQHLDPPVRIFELLRQIAGYTWDESIRPLHTSYDNWHVCGTRFTSPFSTTGTPAPNSPAPYNTASPASLARLASPSTQITSPAPRPNISAAQSDAGSDHSATSPPAAGPTAGATDTPVVEEQIVARISYHVLREERAFHIAKSLISSADPNGEHIAKPLDLVRLAPVPGDRGTIVVAIYQCSGQNYIPRVLDLGPAFYYAEKQNDRLAVVRNDAPALDPPISLQNFLDFAIGATQCLEMIHHGQGLVHGEIRGDAFHYRLETGKVKLISFGSGLRSFEHGLTSTGWSSLSKEVGAKNKLQYISPEQTGRMPVEPDSRTDIYSLGVLFWTLLTQQAVFQGDTPLDIVQGVLGRRIPNVSAIRVDIPDVIGRIIQKCTSKNVGDRYYSASGLRYDLVKVQQLLGDGNVAALKEFQIASRDVSSFFRLPSMLIGRDREKATLLKVIDRVARSHVVNKKGRTDSSNWSDGVAMQNDYLDGTEASSEGASSGDGANRQSGSFVQASSSDPKSRHSLQQSVSLSVSGLDPATTSGGETMSSGNSTMSVGIRGPRPWDRQHSVSFESSSLNDSAVPSAETSSSLSRQLGSSKFRRQGHCEIVTIEGAGGLGKSYLVQSILGDARRRGYCATAKFDTARRTAFGPLLKLLSSLFRQVWGERNTETPFHQALKQHIRPLWPMLHKVLGLPEFLLGAADGSPSVRSSASSGSRTGPSSLKRRGSSPDIPGSSSSPRDAGKRAGKSSQDFLRAGTSTKTIRLMNTFLDVLRMFTHYKFICFCLDDLHFADTESLELITQIIAAKLKMVIIITYRPEELSPETVQAVINPPKPEEYGRRGGPSITKLVLQPLAEEDIVQYVSATLSLPKEEVLPLALVIQSKTAGNPFYMREMLSAGHRKKCIWHDYHAGHWKYDLDRLFEQFQGEQDYDVLDTAFITRRLSELPPASRSILAWAALLGQTFSFDLICKLMEEEYPYDDEPGSEPQKKPSDSTSHQEDAVAGLEAAIQACIVVPGDRDDRFRFAHDRYIQAASALKECNARKMHFVIAQTLLRHYATDPTSTDNTASHICESVDIIRKRVSCRYPYRKLLYDCAREASVSGARPTAAKYYSNAVALLQPDPWADGAEDVSYEETIQLYLQAAECHLYMGHHSAANVLLQTIFDRARTPPDKAPAWVLQSRIFAQSGDSKQALESLSRCLDALGVDLDEHRTMEKCDVLFEALSVKIQTMDRSEIINRPATPDEPRLSSLGAVLAEAASAGWWTDCLSFYHLSLVMVEMYLDRGPFPQSGLAFLYLSIVALARFNMVHFAVDLGSICLGLLEKHRDPFSMARGYMIYANFVAHVQYPIGDTLTQLQDSVDYAAAAGDRISTILSFGLCAQLRLFAGENCSDLEAFCQYSCEEIPNWHLDTRGGTLLIAVRQVCRALQGKTRVQNPFEVLSDDQHNTLTYKTWLKANTNNGDRSLVLYETLEMIPLFLYGHYERAIEIGQKCYDSMELIWSSRNTRLALLFYGLSLAGVVLRQQQDPRPMEGDHKPRVEETVEQITELNKKIKAWQVINNVNYLSWSKLLDAQVSEMRGYHGTAIQQYEQALDHASEHSFVFDEALGNYLMANIFIRTAGRRSARSALRDAVGLYRQMGATGIAERIAAEHSLLLHGPIRNPRSSDVAVQTDFAGDAASVQYRTVDGGEGVAEAQETTQAAVAALKGERMSAWRGSSSTQPEAGAGLPALDMIDLHAILVSSQVISSVLRVDELLKTMCDVILQTCSGSATLAAIVVQDEGGSDWCVAASGDPEKGAEAHIPGIPLSGTNIVAENVILYCTRFREVVFLRDLVNDERFGNVSEGWLRKNPSSKAVIAIPICHGSKPLLGVLYLEGVPGSFTDRNVTVLQLLVNQIGISYSNALSMKAVEKVSAENVSMVALQKRALAKAIEAETKAKNAEAEAIRNVKLAEEAAKAKGIFLANVSHELRTPLNGVIGNSELLRDSNLTQEQLEMADSIRVSADLLLTVINDILDFSRMEADKMKLYIIAFNPEEMVREVVRAASYSNREKTSKKNVRIIQDIKLPPMLIYGDPIRLHQVLGNLIGNSLKFTEDGSITIGARVDSETQDRATLTFWVRDTGIGISPQQLDKLFQPFSQADASTARKYGGSGLGLSICKSLIETTMKGKIQLDSQEGVGTTAWFTVTFDKAKPEVVAGAAQNSPTVLPEPPQRSLSIVDTKEPSPKPYFDISQIPKDKLRVCIAEDNAINAKIAMQYMQRLGYPNVDTYDNGQKAVEGLREKAQQGIPYHIILMDVQMPVLDGYEATKLLRNDPIEAVRKVLVIAMTASAIQGDREKCLEAGMNDYLAKPVRSELLKKKLDTYLLGHPPGQPPDAPPPSFGFKTSPHSRFASSDPDRRLAGPPHPSLDGSTAAAQAPGASAALREINGVNVTALPTRAAPLSTTAADPAFIPSVPNAGSQQHAPPIDDTTAQQTRRGSSDTWSLDGGGSGEPVSPLSTTKRQPKKLTKTRNNSDTQGEKPAKAVLQKKNSLLSARRPSVPTMQPVIAGPAAADASSSNNGLVAVTHGESSDYSGGSSSASMAGAGDNRNGDENALRE